MKFECACGKKLEAPDKFRGRQGHCPQCGAVVKVPIHTAPLDMNQHHNGLPTSRFKPKDLFEHVIGTVVEVIGSRGHGSGVMITGDGIGATNRHVVGLDETIKVKIPDLGEREAGLVRSYKDIDLAFFKVNFLTNNSYAKFVDFENIHMGEPVFAIGHPFGFENSFTRGIISSVAREIDGVNYIQTDASINPGNSGGPLFNEYAQLIGINTMGIRDSQGLNFAIPSRIVQERFKELEASLQENSSINYCGVCGKNSPDPEYCSYCGSKFSQLGEGGWPSWMDSKSQDSQCWNCGIPVDDSSAYCSGCGTRLK